MSNKESSEESFSEDSTSEYDMCDGSSRSGSECDYCREDVICFTDADPIDRNIYLSEITNKLEVISGNKDLCELITNYSKSIANMVELIQNGLKSIKHLRHPTQRLYSTAKDFKMCYADLVDELLRDQLEEIIYFIENNK